MSVHYNVRFCPSIIKSRSYTTKKFKKVTHCLFDLDGTVLDSEIIYHNIIREICEKYRRKYSKELENQLHGVTDHQLCTAIVRELKMPISADEFELQLSNSLKTLLPSAPLKEGAEHLLIHLNDYKIPLALVTNSTEQAVRMHATARPKLFGLFSHKVSINDTVVRRGKPHPDIYVLAASKFSTKPRPSQCLVFEDSDVGVEAAIRAEMQVVMIPDHRRKRETNRLATLVIHSLLDFKPELFGLPPFNDSTKLKNKKKLEPSSNGEHK